MGIIPVSIIRAKNRQPIIKFYFNYQAWFLEFDENTRYFDKEVFKRRLLNDWPKFNYQDFEVVLLSDTTTTVSEYESHRNARYIFTYSDNLRGV